MAAGPDRDMRDRNIETLMAEVIGAKAELGNALSKLAIKDEQLTEEKELSQLLMRQLCSRNPPQRLIIGPRAMKAMKTMKAMKAMKMKAKPMKAMKMK